MRKQVPPDKTTSVLEFATMRPFERLNSISNGLGVRRGCVHLISPLTVDLKVLDYGQSEYVREFGMTVEEQPLRTQARVINAPTLRYHQSSKQPSAVSIVLISPDLRRFSEFMPATTRWCLEPVRLLAIVCLSV
jgi:eukaryotic translation initiation factor 2C